MSALQPNAALPTAPPERNLANLLRWLGTAAVALSAVIFLLQGLGEMDAVSRSSWSLALMLVLTGAGVGSRTLLGDAAGARLLLGLAVALVPVQFAQLGGMIHSLASTDASNLTDLLGLESLEPVAVAILAVASLALAPLIALFGFSVLVRPAARASTWWFLLPNMVLLLSWRDSVAGFAVLAVLAALTVLVDGRLARLDPRFTTAEGRAARFVFLLPLAIATARLAFHLEALSGYCALVGFVAAGLIYAGRHYMAASGLREALYMAGTAIGVLAWWVWMNARLGGADLDLAWMLIPAAALLIAVGRLSTLGRAYRTMAALLTLMAAASLCAADALMATFAALVLGLLSLGYGCLCREREPTIAGAVVSVAAVAVLAEQAVQHVEVSGWVALATAGVLLVLGASVVERYGQPLLGAARGGWQTVRDWQ